MEFVNYNEKYGIAPYNQCGEPDVSDMPELISNEDFWWPIRKAPQYYMNQAGELDVVKCNMDLSPGWYERAVANSSAHKPVKTDSWAGWLMPVPGILAVLTAIWLFV